MTKALTNLSHLLITSYDKEFFEKDDKTISVNPMASELASWYEKFRTAMDYREDEVILRSAIERILKRRMLLSTSGQTIAAPLIRELIWARYFPDSSIPEAIVSKVSQRIDLYFKLESEINKKHRINKGVVNEWILHLLSSDIEHILKPNDPKDLMCNFIFRIFRERVTISDDTEESKDVQVFIAARRAFANDDLPFLRYHLFKQYFGSITEENLAKISDNFVSGLKILEEQFQYPAKDKIYSYIKNQTIPFLILDDVFRKFRGEVDHIVSDEDRLNLEIINACATRYKSIRAKVNRAIIRSVVFIFFTKALFALSIEGTFEKIYFGQVLWTSMALNTLTPAILMIIVGLLIHTPSRDNSFKIVKKINTILFDEEPILEKPLSVKKRPSKTDPILWVAFFILWLTTFVLSFGAIIFVLSNLSVNPLSQAVFIFFLAVVSFIAYRVNRTAHMYIIKDKKDSFTSLLFDFFFMPFIQVGQRLTLAISQLNIVLFVFDFIIETPFKGIVAFFEQWLLFLRTQREKLD